MGFRRSQKYSFHRPMTSSVEVSKVQSLLYTARMVPRFPLLRCQTVFQKSFGVTRKSLVLGSDRGGHSSESCPCVWRQAPPDPTGNAQPPTPALALSAPAFLQPLPPMSGAPRPITSTATLTVSPADGGSTGWGRKNCHNPRWAWLQTWAPGFLQAGSLVLHLCLSWGLCEPYLVWPLT